MISRFIKCLIIFIIITSSGILCSEPAGLTGDILTPEELAWLAEHDGKIRLAPDPEWAPVEFFDINGKYSGIAADYVRLLEKRLGFSFVIVTGKDWATIIEKAKKREIDVFGAATWTPQRAEYLMFTDSFIVNTSVIITRREVSGILKLENLAGVKVLVGKGYANHDYLVNNYPYLNIVTVPDIKTGMRMVSFGEAYALVADIASASYYINQDYISNLKISGETSHRLELAFASRNDWPLLNSILRKGLSTVTEKERGEIRSRWINIGEVPFYKSKSFWFAVLTAVGIFSGVIFMVFLWNRMLRLEVERKTMELCRSQEELKDSLRRNSAIINSMPDMIFIISKEGIYRESIFADEAELAFDAKSIIGRNVSELPLASDMLSQISSAIHKTLDTGEMQKIVYTMDLPEQSRIFEARMVPFDSGSILTFVRNITEQKASEEEIRRANRELEETSKALKESERKLSALLSNLPGIAYRCENNSEWSMIYISRGCLDVTGYSPDEFLENGELTFGGIIHVNDRARVWETVQHAVSIGELFDVRYRIISKNDGIRWIWNRGSAVSNHEKIEFLEGFITDITELEKKEEQLRQIQKMETVGNLAGGLAHDFNNVLGGIIGSLSLLENQIKNDAVPDIWKCRSFLSTAKVSSDRAAGMVRQLLLLSREHESEFITVKIEEAIKNIVEICKNSFPKSIEIRINEDDNSYPVMADPVQIEQVLLNLCVNASHSMTIMRSPGENEGGVLTIKTGIVSADSHLCMLHPEAEKGILYCVINVDDTGVGMDDDVRSRIFEPFFTTKKGEKGIGLGLYMVYSIIRDHHGFIDIYSEKGAGSSFMIYIPLLSESHEGSKSNDSGTGLFRGSGSVLVIDDEIIMLGIAEEMFQCLGFQVLTASTGDGGLEIFSKNIDKLKMVLLDVSMPGMSGEDVCRKMVEFKRDIPVILSSGSKMDFTVEHGIGAGASGFIQKPYTLAELSGKINEILSKGAS